MPSPLVIGGTGGSGTRVVASIARLGGRYMGDERNSSEDAMALARFDWEWGLHYLESGPGPAMTAAFEGAVEEHLSGRPEGAPWGWKHPHSYLLVPFLHDRFPDLRFVHVIRDGRDVALSDNQQQARHYGRILRRPQESEQARSAAWWAWANERARTTGSALGDRYLRVRFEDLCADPPAVARRVAEFSGDDDLALAPQVVAPPTLGRWRRCDRALLREIEDACGEALRRFGYGTSGE